MMFFTHSLSSSQVVMASPNTFHERGTACSAVVRMRSNFTNGFS